MCVCGSHHSNDIHMCLDVRQTESNTKKPTEKLTKRTQKKKINQEEIQKQHLNEILREKKRTKNNLHLNNYNVVAFKHCAIKNVFQAIEFVQTSYGAF